MPIIFQIGVISFTGRVEDEDKINLHKVFDLYAITSPVELQSIATLESMASGNPVVAVDAMALGELCQNERNGFLRSKIITSKWPRLLTKF